VEVRFLAPKSSADASKLRVFDTGLPRAGHDFRAFQLQTAASSHLIPGSPMPIAKVRASTILGAFEQAQTELVGKAVILTDGKAGTVENVWLDELHGLRISIKGHDGKWPVSTVKFAQS
jgi:hypothetical protein